MAKKDEKYIYAKPEAQLLRMNRALLMGYSIYYMFVFVTCLSQMNEKGIYKMNALVCAGIAVASFLILLFMLAKKKDSPRIRYTSLMLLLVGNAVTTLSFDAYFLNFIGAAPLIGCILYYDKRFTKKAVLYYFLDIVICSSIRAIVAQSNTGMSILQRILQTVSLLIILLIILLTETIGEDFMKHMLGSLEDEKEHAHQMVEEIIAVAEQVQESSENAMDYMQELSASTLTVSSAVDGITKGTQLTAESVASQTSMTQDIQTSIQDTLKASSHMVEIAEESERLNSESTTVVNELKEHATAILKTNQDVKKIMNELRDCCDAVQGITQTISAISAQTNLLALNASIESARAGEAGRGFAVVADEIRQLAEKTKTETENIGQVIGELTSKASQAEGAVEKSSEASGRQDELISKMASNFEGLNQNVAMLTDEIDRIDSMINTLSTANQEIVDNISQISANTQEITASTEEADSLSSRNIENAEKTKKKLDHILQESQKLQKYTNEV